MQVLLNLFWISLGIAAGFLVLLVICNVLGVRNLIVYSILGIGLWLAFLQSGVHATVAGVLMAKLPARGMLATGSCVGAPWRRSRRR